MASHLAFYSVEIHHMEKHNIRLNLQSSWQAVKEKLKENDIRLTDEDLEYKPGSENELVDRLAKKLGRSREQIIAYIESISSNNGLAG